MRRLSLPMTFIIAASLVLTACGGAGSSSKSIKVTMTDFAFTPNSFTVPAGEEITVEITNTGAVAHSFIIMKAGNTVQGHFTEAEKAGILWEQTDVAPGRSVKTSFKAPDAPGQYQIVCGVPGHFEAGMVGKLNVVSAP